MNKKLTIALVGRPNVGKSALFNRLCGTRISIVDDEEGTTRDRIYGQVDLFGHPATLIDTGGITLDPKIPFQEGIREQVQLALKEADRIVMVTDGQVGVTAGDEFIANLLRKHSKKIVLAVNKVDDFSKKDIAYDFYTLGIENVMAISVSQGLHLAELLEMVSEGWCWEDASVEESSRIKVAVIGRPNVGKSTLVNFLLKEQRCVVSPIPGTTRDAIDTDISLDGLEMTLIDTAGVRRKKAEHEVVDKFAAIRTNLAIERSHICLLLLEAKDGLTAQEKKIASMIEEKGKGCIVLINKWDLIDKLRMEHSIQVLKEEAPFLAHCPILCISAKFGRNTNKIASLIQEVRKHQQQRIGTGELNKFIEKTLQLYHPPMIQGKRLRIYYMTHIATYPPTFVLFVNYPNLMLDTYKRYLIHKFRETYQFTGNPLIFALRPRTRSSERLRQEQEG